MKNRILFVTIPEKGHINPLIGAAKQLTKQGQELAFFSQVDISDQLKQAGLNCRCLTPPPNSFKPPEDHTTKGKIFIERLRDKNWLRSWIKRLLLDVVPTQIPALKEQISLFRPDVIVTDPMVYSAVIAATECNIPWAGVSSSLNPVTPNEWTCELVETVNELKDCRKQLFQDHNLNLNFKICDAISPWLNTVFTTESYAPREWSKNDFSFYVGPTIPEGQRGDEYPFPFEKLKTDCQKIYMSLGSQVYYHPELFLTIIEALKEQNVQIIISINELIHDQEFMTQLPDNVIASFYTPQLLLLEHMNIVITHGGANSVMETLAHGLPIVQLPICNDQFLQSKFIQKNNVGVVLDSKNPSIEKFREKILPLLNETATERINAQQIGDSYKKCNGAALTAKLIMQLAAEKQPLKPIIRNT